MRMNTTLFLGAIALFAPLCLPACAAERQEFEPKQVVKKRFPAIVNPRLVPAAEALDLRDDELVIGVQIGDSARAYPINMLTGPTREIVNDRLGGRDIAATW
jgi:hypothetical protein